MGKITENITNTVSNIYINDIKYILFSWAPLTQPYMVADTKTWIELNNQHAFFLSYLGYTDLYITNERPQIGYKWGTKS